ncbi:hypothetical protein EB118_01450 [bacterium]|nr:hypothetical protein [bacterium]NBX98558.1 hypothetical protein [bacterium]NDC93809.1 hypothetical protein [bacterium]NDD83599.1 hypothetical protein [bacterium]NDG28755.1 hypothetical protein [bacterium]
MISRIKGTSKKVFTRVKSVKLPVALAESYVVALDIGTENVKALIGRVLRNGTIEIVGVGKAHQSITDMQAGAIADIAAVTTNCDTALAEAEDQAGMSGTRVVIGIAGELVKGSTSTIRIHRKDHQKPIDDTEFSKIIRLVQSRAQQQAKQELSTELGGKDVEVRMVNSALVRILIDGYEITNPIGFQGKEVSVQLYTAFAPMIHIGALERVAEMLDLDLLAVAAEPFAVSRAVLGNDDHNKTNAILMDVGGGTTDLAVVSEGGVMGTKMFGIGGRAFSRSIERQLDVTYLQAEAIKLGLTDGRVPKQKIAEVEAALHSTLEVWTNGVQIALEEFTLETLPHRMLLCGGGSSLAMLVDTLQESKWYSDLPFTKKPYIHHIQPNEVSAITDTTDTITDHTFITAMGLLRVGADTLTTNNMSGSGKSIKDKVNKLLKV